MQPRPSDAMTRTLAQVKLVPPTSVMAAGTAYQARQLPATPRINATWPAFAVPLLAYALIPMRPAVLRARAIRMARAPPAPMGSVDLRPNATPRQPRGT